MPATLRARAVHQGGMRFAMTARAHTVVTDYPLQAGEEGVGQTSLELLLSSLASCTGGGMAVLLKKFGVPFTRLEVTAQGTRRETHPTVLTAIEVEVLVAGADLDKAVVDKALRQCDELLCPVWAMLKPGVPITARLRLEAA